MFHPARSILSWLYLSLFCDRNPSILVLTRISGGDLYPAALLLFEGEA